MQIIGISDRLTNELVDHRRRCQPSSHKTLWNHAHHKAPNYIYYIPFDHLSGIQSIQHMGAEREFQHKHYYDQLRRNLLKGTTLPLGTISHCK